MNNNVKVFYYKKLIKIQIKDIRVKVGQYILNNSTEAFKTYCCNN